MTIVQRVRKYVEKRLDEHAYDHKKCKCLDCGIFNSIKSINDDWIATIILSSDLGRSSTEEMVIRYIAESRLGMET